MLAYKRKTYKQKPKTSKQLERIFKGVSNHHRIDALRLIEKNPGITLEGIAETLDVNLKTISEHLRRLVGAGLITKNYQGKSVVHNLSPYGHKIIKTLETFSYS